MNILKNKFYRGKCIFMQLLFFIYQCVWKLFYISTQRSHYFNAEQCQQFILKWIIYSCNDDWHFGSFQFFTFTKSAVDSLWTCIAVYVFQFGCLTRILHQRSYKFCILNNAKNLEYIYTNIPSIYKCIKMIIFSETHLRGTREIF